MKIDVIHMADQEVPGAPGMIVTTDPHAVLREFTQLARCMQSADPVTSEAMAFFMNQAMRSQHKRGLPAYAGMFLPVKVNIDHPATTGHGREFAQAMGRAIQRSRPYEVTTEMTALMRELYAGLSVGDIDRVSESDLPDPAGIAWLDDGWSLVSTDGSPVTLRVVSWERMSADTLHPGWATPSSWPCVRLSVWAHSADDVFDARFTDTDKANLDRQLGTRLSIMHTTLLPLDLEFGHEDASAGEMAGAMSFLGMMTALWHLIRSEVSATRRVQMPPKEQARNSRRRSLNHDTLNVVLLRRVKHPRTGEEVPATRVIHWRWRWFVDPFWRHYRTDPAFEPHRPVASQDTRTCAVCGGRVVHVDTYEKGPQGAPLKPKGDQTVRDGHTIFKVAR